MKSGDSRGPGGSILPHQVHPPEFNRQDQKIAGRQSVMATRFYNSNDLGTPVEDKRLGGDQSGFHVWPPKGGGSAGTSGPLGAMKTAGKPQGGAGAPPPVVKNVNGSAKGKTHKPHPDFYIYSTATITVAPANQNFINEFVPAGTFNGFQFLGLGHELEYGPAPIDPHTGQPVPGSVRKPIVYVNPPGSVGGNKALELPPEGRDPFSPAPVSVVYQYPEGFVLPNTRDDFISGGNGFEVEPDSRTPGDPVTPTPPASPTPSPPISGSDSESNPTTAGVRDLPTWREIFPVTTVGGGGTAPGGGIPDAPVVTPGGGGHGTVTTFIYQLQGYPATSVVVGGITYFWTGNATGGNDKYNADGSVLSSYEYSTDPPKPGTYPGAGGTGNNTGLGGAGGLTADGGGSIYGQQFAQALDQGPTTIVLPVKGLTYDPDFTMEPYDVGTTATQPYWPRFPGGYYGATTCTMDADVQINVFHPTDPRLVAVNRDASSVSCGTIICDVNIGRMDVGRAARLQSLVRVIRGPQFKKGLGKDHGFTGNSGVMPNALALQLGISGAGDAIGGFAADGVVGGGTVMGVWSARSGGCMDVGLPWDVHQIGIDAEGNPINPMHISTDALFAEQTGNYDGPINFEHKEGPVCGDKPYPVRVHLVWNQSSGAPRTPKASGFWELYSTYDMAKVPVQGPTTPSGPRPPGRPVTPPGPPVTPPGGTPGVGGATGYIQGGSTGLGTPSGGGFPNNVFGGQATLGQLVPGAASLAFHVDPQLGYVSKGSSRDLRVRHHVAMIAELGSPGFLARPQRYVDGAPDLRQEEGWGNPEAVKYQDRYVPVVGRLSSYGAQGGRLGGPYINPDGGGTQVGGIDGWVRTQQLTQSRHIGGTASGGYAFLNPEIDLSDIDDNLAPAGLTKSTTYLVMTPGTRLGFGLPELAAGGLKSGFSIESNAGGLAFNTHSATGVPTAAGTVSSGVWIIPFNGTFPAAASTRANLGLGTMAVQDASAVAITGGSITGITDLAVADGGTGASNAAGARGNLGMGDVSGFSISGLAEDKTIDTSAFTGDVAILAQFVTALWNSLKNRSWPIA